MTLKPSDGADGKLEWIKSSYSSDDGPSCVEVATAPATVHVRDSKVPHGPRLALAPATWATFLPYASGH
ncbi:DUF397 domain-containing protein [Streptomyces sp. PU10]|uniref:DUF397 domain-containing protein n=1 Tax=unclassified Streptomyces TaxID=2593676 RepID=UPI000C9B9CB8|nr:MULTISPECIES: DUF397 domain-containing protein [unclassified Streptomyces]MDU0255390.1 DUF397 domain-containing protein [Streptomyces sp. PU10]WSU02172.1 DUF397 domain-containing protein [Streptomyces sp. NBC_01124]